MGSIWNLESFGCGLSELPFKIRYTKEYINKPIKYSIRLRRCPNSSTFRPIFFSISDKGVDMNDKYNSDNILQYYQDKNDYWNNNVCVEGGKDLTIKLKYENGKYSDEFNINNNEYFNLENQKVTQLIIGVVKNSKEEKSKKIVFPEFDPKEVDKIYVNKPGCKIYDKNETITLNLVDCNGCDYPSNKSLSKNEIHLHYSNQVKDKTIELFKGVKVFTTSWLDKNTKIKFNKNIKKIDINCLYKDGVYYDVLDLSNLKKLESIELDRFNLGELILPENICEVKFFDLNCDKITFKSFSKLQKLEIVNRKGNIKVINKGIINFNFKHNDTIYSGIQKEDVYYFNNEILDKNRLSDICFRIGAKELSNFLKIPYKIQEFYKKYKDTDEKIEYGKYNGKIDLYKGKYPILHPWWERYHLPYDCSIYHYYNHDKDKIEYVEHDEIHKLIKYNEVGSPVFNHTSVNLKDDSNLITNLIKGLKIVYGDKLDEFLALTNLQ